MRGNQKGPKDQLALFRGPQLAASSPGFPSASLKDTPSPSFEVIEGPSASEKTDSSEVRFSGNEAASLNEKILRRVRLF